MPKLRIICDIEASRSLINTIKRTGFTVCEDGSGFQVKIANSPPIPKRKVQTRFIDAPSKPLEEIGE